MLLLVLSAQFLVLSQSFSVCQKLLFEGIQHASNFLNLNCEKLVLILFNKTQIMG